MKPSGEGVTHIEVTAALVRLYVFLSQYVDRCLNHDTRTSDPDDELRAHLAATKSMLLDLVSVNPVVKTKVEQEYDRILSQGATSLQGGAEDPGARQALLEERAALKQKTIALSDLLAVFRARA